MTTKQVIEIEGLPEGWRAVAYRHLKEGDDYINNYGNISKAHYDSTGIYLIVEKIRPRRIVLEETGKDNIRYRSGHYANQCIALGIYVADQPKIWREVKEE